MKLLIPIIFTFLTLKSYAQIGDMIAIKKKNRTIQSFYKGAQVSFINTNGEWVNCRVSEVRDDSLFYNDIIIRQTATQWGGLRLDTFTLKKQGIHFSEIAGIPRKKESFTFIKNGSIFMIGGAGYIGLNLVNSVYLKDPPLGKDNLPNLLIASGVFGIGKLMNVLRKPYLRVGKKYSVHYIGLTANR